MTGFGGRALFTILFFAFACTILYLTLGLGRVARAVPLAVVVPTVLLLAFQVLLDFAPRLAQKYGSLEKNDLFGVAPLREKSRRPDSEAAIEPETEIVGRRRRERGIFLWLLLLFALLYLLGFLIALPFYTLLYLKRRSGESWLQSVIVAAAMGCLVYALSVLDPGSRLHEGELLEWLRR